MLLAIGFLLFNVMRFFDLLGDPTYFWVMDLVFTGIVAVSLSLIALAIWRVRHPHPAPWQPNLPARPLMALAILLLSMNVVTGLASPPDDAGFYTNLGAQRLRERGKFPYGDPLLTNSAGAGYGPLLYLAPPAVPVHAGSDAAEHHASRRARIWWRALTICCRRRWRRS